MTSVNAELYHREFDAKNERYARELEKCRECGGHGADPMSDNVNWLPCQTCGGTGSVTEGGRSE